MVVFDGVIFHLSPSLSDERRSELKHVLLQNGAGEARSIHLATHVITNTNKFEGCQDVGAQVAVVTDMWVERSVILGKVQLPSHYSSDPAMIFSGVVACATELPSTDVEVLSAGIAALGGQWRTALTRDVTHLFCVSNTSPKYETAMHFKEQTHVHVLLPHWFDDSVRLGARDLPVESYEWPDPPFLRGPLEIEIGLTKSKESDHASYKPEVDKKTLYKSMLLDDYNSLPSQSTNIWNGRRIILSLSLELTSSRRKAVEAGIARCGGIMVPYVLSNGNEEEVENVSKCDVLVTKWRSGRAYVRAVRGNKTIGTLGWVFYVHATGTVSRPMDQLLHYPIPRRPVEGFSSHEITVTNYTGEAREYLKKLITTMGATFTPSMTGRNTVLIAAYLSGTKTTKAAAWSIPIVNHTWLEDCFVKWRNLTVGVEKYIVFPPGIDFSNLLGERGVGGGFVIAGATNPAAVSSEEGVGIGGWVGLESEGELDTLEGEDDLFNADTAGMDDEGSVGGEVDRPLVIGQTSSPLQRKVEQPRGDAQSIGIPPSSPVTQGSTDAREVEAVVNLMEDVEDVETVAHSPKSKRKENEKRKTQGASPHKVDDNVENKSRTKMEFDGANDGANDVVLVKKSKDVKSYGTKSRKKYVAEAVEIRKGEKKGRSKNLTEESEESDVIHDTPKKGKAKGKAKARDETDETDETEGNDEGGTILQKLKSEKVVGKVKKVEARKECEEETVLAKRQAEISKKVKSNKSDIKRKWKRIVKRDKEEESDEEEENDRRAKDTSRALTSKKVDKRKFISDDEDDDDDDEVSSKIKSLGTPSKIRDSSPLSPPPKSPDATLMARSSKRSAALKASQRLHNEVMPDMNSYQSALRKGRISLASAQEQLLKASERSTPLVNNRKRKGAEAVDDEGDGDDKLDVKKKRRVSFDYTKINDSKNGIKAVRAPENNIMLLTTHVILSDDVSKALVKLGVKFTTHATECTHLIAPKIVRTEKFLCAIASAPFVLSDQWATRSAAAKKLLQKKFLLQDDVGEGKFSFALKDAVQRAKHGKIFADKTFYVTPRVPTDLQLLRNVITSCGGQFSTTTPTVRILNASNRLVISCPEDIAIWRPLAAHHPIYNQELVLTGALKQLAEWDNDSFRVPGSF